MGVGNHHIGKLASRPTHSTYIFFPTKNLPIVTFAPAFDEKLLSSEFSEYSVSSLPFEAFFMAERKADCSSAVSMSVNSMLLCPSEDSFC